METTTSASFTDQWHAYTLNAAYVFGGLALLITIVYYIKLLTIKSYSRKYEFVSANEAKYFWYALLSVVIGAALFLNSYIQLLFAAEGGFEFIFGLFISVILGVAIGYAAYAYFKYYYPSVIEDKLTKLRFRPRISPETGKQMKLLDESEEDVHLTEEMIAHEEEAVYEYDVWIDEETGHKFIERYDIHLHALVCPNCSFRTLKDYKEEVVKEPTHDEPGLMKNYYSCSYCDHAEIREVRLAPLKEEEGAKILS
ncbi:hypothetical protein, partial [Fulvivirga aurantia]|uniref:hypothetical protein n=1 Tax=Fulvivirga aurantia TaxID=2529383 RepID=UPI0016289381